MRKYFHIILIHYLLLNSGFAIAKCTSCDSLVKAISVAKNDSDKVKMLNRLAKLFIYSNVDTSVILSNQAMHLAEKVDFKPGIALAHQQLGAAQYLMNDYFAAIDNYRKAMVLWIKLDDKAGKALTFGNMGLVYQDQGNYSKALDYFLLALKTDEEIKNDIGVARHLGNIGTIYSIQKNYHKALDYYLKALKMKEKIGTTKGVGGVLGNIGIVYQYLGDFKNAMNYYLKALELDIALGNEAEIAAHYCTIGNLYNEQKDYIKAMEFYLKAEKIYTDLHDKKGLALTLGNIGAVYIMQNKISEAEAYLKHSIVFSKEIGSMNEIYISSEHLSRLYESKGQNKLALEYLQNAIAAKDSVFNIAKKSEIARHEMNYEFEKREAKTKAEQNKRDAILAADKRKHNTVLTLVGFVFILIFIFVGVVLRNLSIARKQKRVIEYKNAETENQKAIIEEKNRNIMASIYYARRIQNSLLPTHKYIQKKLTIINQIKE